jgi:single-stranded DNA-specific DHH superfamily exonuclease
MVAATKTGIKNMEEVAPFLENTGYQAEARNLREQIKQSHAEIRDLEEQIRNVHKNR